MVARKHVEPGEELTTDYALFELDIGSVCGLSAGADQESAAGRSPAGIGSCRSSKLAMQGTGTPLSPSASLRRAPDRADHPLGSYTLSELLTERKLGRPRAKHQSG